MTPKQKAEELFAKYAFLTISDMSDENFNQTKQCALIAVDEILDECLSLKEEFWEEVREEIENL
jgi:hypothetical protein